MNGRTRQQLFATLHEQFDLSELRKLAFDLGLDHENLPGETRRDFVISLISTAQNHGKLEQLNALLNESLVQRANVPPRSPQPESQNRIPFLLIGLVAIVIVVVALIWLWPTGDRPNGTATPADTILLQVQVVSSDNQTAVANAKVTLSLADQLFPQERTDSNGIAVFRLSAETRDEIARITVEANEQVEDQTITVKPGMSAVEFQIRP